MASVRKRTWGEGKTAFVVQWIDEKKKNRSKSFKKKKDADAFRLHIDNEIASGLFMPSAGKFTVFDVFRQYFDECWTDQKNGNLKAQYIETLERVYNANVKQYDDVDCACMTQRDFDILYRAILQDTKPSLHVIVRNIFANAFRRAYERGKISRDYFGQSTVKIAIHKRRRRVASEDEVRTLLEHCDQSQQGQSPYEAARLKTSIAIAAYAGLRIGEICGLTWDDIDFKSSTISVARAIDAKRRITTPKTGSSVRIVPMAPPLAKIVKAFRDLGAGIGYVIAKQTRPLQPMVPTSQNHTMSALMRRVEMVDDAGTPLFAFHGLRHYAASWLLGQGVPVPAVSEFMGHSNPHITMSVYAHKLKGDDSVRLALANAPQQNANKIATSA